METISGAKEYLRETMLDGSTCPVCNQFVKVYKRSINGSSLLALMIIYQTKGKQSVHVTNYLNNYSLPAAVKNTGDFAKLRFWGIIEKDNTTIENNSNNSGYWKITDFGEMFLKGEVNIPRHKFLYNNSVVKIQYEQPDLPYSELVTNKFDYRKLMNS